MPSHQDVMRAVENLNVICTRLLWAYHQPGVTEDQKQALGDAVVTLFGTDTSDFYRLVVGPVPLPRPPVSSGPCDLFAPSALRDLLGDLNIDFPPILPDQPTNPNE